MAWTKRFDNLSGTAECDMRQAFSQFGRNGRWGDCASCPRDAEGHAFPEFCSFTDRYDHQLSLGGLVFQYLIRFRDANAALWTNEEALRQDALRSCDLEAEIDRQVLRRR